MPIRHGAYRAEDGTYEFFWLGNRLSMEEFNEQTLRTASSLKDEVSAMAEGMDIAACCDAGRETVVRLEAIEEILKLPLCEACRRMIGR